MKIINYTPEQTELLLSLYSELGNEGIEDIAMRLGKQPRSVIAKLTKEEVYVAPDRKNRVKATGPSKKELVLALTELTGKTLQGIEGATKTSLAELIEAFKSR